MPKPLLRLATIANCRPITPANIARLIAIGCAIMMPAVAMPANAPITVGIIVSASRRYVLRSTRFWESASVVDAVRSGAIIGDSGCIQSLLGRSGGSRSTQHLEYGTRG